MPETPRTRNDYRQLRITLTEQTGMRVTVEGWVKRRGDQWHMRNRVWARTYRMSDAPATLPACYRLLAAELLREAASLEQPDQ